MKPDQPNILVIVADCARGDAWTGADRTAVTPNVDALAQKGLSFTTAITEKSSTTPSLATLLTGRYSYRHGVHLVWGYRLPESIPTLPEILSSKGYHCYAEVTGPLIPEMGLTRGFENYEYRAPCDYLHTRWGDEFLEQLRSGHYKSPWFILLHLWELHTDRQVVEGFDKPEFGKDTYARSTSSLDAQLGRVFEAVGDDTAIVFTGDHGEKTPAETYRPGTAVDYARKLLNLDEVDGFSPMEMAKWGGPSVLQQFYGQATPMMQDVSLRNGQAQLEYSKWDKLKDRLRLVRLLPFLLFWDLFSLSAPVKLTKLLKKRGLLDPERAKRKVDRLIGSMGNQRALDMQMRMWINSYKHNIEEGHIIHVYDYLVRVPFIIHWPGAVPAGRRIDRLVRQPDMTMTLLELLGLSAEALGEVDGRSLMPLVRDEPWQPIPAYLSLTGAPADLEMRGIRTEDYKYTFGPHNPDLPEELYDLKNDPHEIANIAASEPERCAELRQQANSFLPASGTEQSDVMTVTQDQQKQVEKHLEELGYL